MFDHIVVGAGIAGIVLAERIANVLGKQVLIIEKRDHIGGNCYDYRNEYSILIHKYGPHVFHTQLKNVWDYLSNFTDWNSYHHKVLGYVNGKKIPIPFNLNSLNKSYPSIIAQQMTDKLIQKYGLNAKIPILELKKSKDGDLCLLADYVYNNVFLNYTKKQWGMKPEELDPSVTARVPVLVSRNDCYFQDPYQGLPSEGYTKMFERMTSNPNIEIKLNTDYKELIDFDYNGEVKFSGGLFNGKMIFTGEIDYFFDYEFGKLPYRTLDFDFETLNQEVYQEVGVVNYPNDYKFTRITEFKHLTGEKNPKTTISKEYPRDCYEKDDISYYPIPKEENIEIYRKYQRKAREFDNLIFVGRLAEYQYYNMDQVVDRALTIFQEKIK